MKIYKKKIKDRRFEYWYDPHYRCWFCQEINDTGLIGSSHDAYTKKEIIGIIEYISTIEISKTPMHQWVGY